MLQTISTEDGKHLLKWLDEVIAVELHHVSMGTLTIPKSAFSSYFHLDKGEYTNSVCEQRHIIAYVLYHKMCDTR